MARVTTADRVQQITDRTSMAAQQRLTTETQQVRVAQETQVQQTPEAQSEQIDSKAQRRNPYVGRRRRKAPRHETPKEQVESPASGDEVEPHQLDVSI
jgi:hypothetical protein